MLIDGNLVWHSQIDKITQKIASGIGAIEQIRPFAKPGTLRYICNALVQPHFSYCSAVWKIAVKRYQPEISYGKKKEAWCHIVTSSSYDADAWYLLQQLRWKYLIF